MVRKERRQGWQWIAKVPLPQFVMAPLLHYTPCDSSLTPGSKNIICCRKIHTLILSCSFSIQRRFTDYSITRQNSTAMKIMKNISPKTTTYQKIVVDKSQPKKPKTFPNFLLPNS